MIWGYHYFRKNSPQERVIENSVNLVGRAIWLWHICLTHVCKKNNQHFFETPLKMVLFWKTFFGWYFRAMERGFSGAKMWVSGRVGAFKHHRCTLVKLVFFLLPRASAGFSVYFDKGYLYAEYMATLLHLGLPQMLQNTSCKFCRFCFWEKTSQPQDITLVFEVVSFPGGKNTMESHGECW